MYPPQLTREALPLRDGGDGDPAMEKLAGPQAAGIAAPSVDRRHAGSPLLSGTLPLPRLVLQTPKLQPQE